MVATQFYSMKAHQLSLAWLHKLSMFGCLVFLATPACVQPVWPQASGHQRLGVEAKTYWEADIEWAVRLSPVGYSDYSLPDLDSSLSFGFLLDGTWSASLSFPFSLSSRSSYTAPVLLVPGDVSASIGWTAIRGDGRVRGSFNLTGPSAIWQGDQDVPGSRAGGSGRWTIGLTGGLSRIIDPLVLGALVSWSIGLPRAERWDTQWRPGDFSLVLSVTEAFNDHVSATAVLSQFVSVPEIAWGTRLGKLPSGVVDYDASAGVRLLVSGQSFSVGIGFSKSLVYGADPGSLGFSVACFIRQREGP